MPSDTIQDRSFAITKMAREPRGTFCSLKSSARIALTSADHSSSYSTSSSSSPGVVVPVRNRCPRCICHCVSPLYMPLCRAHALCMYLVVESSLVLKASRRDSSSGGTKSRNGKKSVCRILAVISDTRRAAACGCGGGGAKRLYGAPEVRATSTAAAGEPGGRVSSLFPQERKRRSTRRGRAKSDGQSPYAP